MAKIPNGDFSSITVEEDPNNDSSSSWNTEIFRKKQKREIKSLFF